MATVSGDYCQCILCCRFLSSPLPAKSGGFAASGEIIYNFIQQTGVVNLKNFSVSGLLGLKKEIVMCEDCLSAVDRANAKRKRVEVVEGQVRNMQLEVLKMMKQLGHVMEVYLEEMRSIESKIKNTEERLERTKLAGRKRMEKKTSWDKARTDEFRNGIVNAVKDLTKFRNDLSSKTGAPADTEGNFDVEVKREPEVEADGEEEVETTVKTEVEEDPQSDSNWDWEKYDEMLKARERKDPDKDPELYICHRCGKSYQSEKSLNSHLHLTCIVGLNLRCSLCGKGGFKTKPTLRSHERQHEFNVSRPFMCNLCGGDFNSSGNYNRHRKRCDGSKKPRKPRWSNMLLPILPEDALGMNFVGDEEEEDGGGASDPS